MSDENIDYSKHTFDYFLKKFLFSRKNIMASIMTIMIVILYFFNVISNLWLLAPLTYALVYAFTPKEKNMFVEAVENKITQITANKDVLSLLNLYHNKINADSRFKNNHKEIFKSISKESISLLKFIKENKTNTLNMDFMDFQNIFEKYIPKLLEQYQKLPLEYIDAKMPNDQKNPEEMLTEQLNIINDQIKEIAQNVYQGDINKLKANGLFLKQKFEDNSLELEN